MDKAVDVPSEIYANQVKLFGKWNCDEVEVGDISLQVFISFISKIFNIHQNFILFSSRITYQLKAKLQNIYHTQLVVIKLNALEKHYVQLLNV